MLKFIGWCYAAVVLTVGSWAWAVDIALRNDPREHLAPDILFAIVTMPLSLALDSLWSAAPDFFWAPFMELASLTVAAALQVAFLFALGACAGKMFSSAPNNRWRGP